MQVQELWLTIKKTINKAAKNECWVKINDNQIKQISWWAEENR